MSDFSPAHDPDISPDAPTEDPSGGFNWKTFLREVFETVGLAVVLFLAINIISARVRVDGSSMRPTLQDGEFVLVTRTTGMFGGYQRGDIVVFRPPMYPPENPVRLLLGMPSFTNQYEDYIKRIVGLPGETVKVAGGQVYINGAALTEPYIAAPPQYSGEWTVPADQLFVLGDNRNDSSDSHQWGFLPISNVLGKALLVYWPFPNWAILHSDQAALAAP